MNFILYSHLTAILSPLFQIQSLYDGPLCFIRLHIAHNNSFMEFLKFIELNAGTKIWTFVISFQLLCALHG